MTPHTEQTKQTAPPLEVFPGGSAYSITVGVPQYHPISTDGLPKDAGHYGPQTPEVEAFISSMGNLTEAQWIELDEYERNNAQYLIEPFALRHGYDYLQAALDEIDEYTDGRRWNYPENWLSTIEGLLLRHALRREKYDYLTGPWRIEVGPIHPDDPEAKMDTETRLAWVAVAKTNPGWSPTECAEAAYLITGREQS